MQSARVKVGDESQFAIECKISPHALQSNLLMGHLCIWAKDYMVGHFDYPGNELWLAVEEFKRSLQFSGKRWFEEFTNVQPETVLIEVFNRLREWTNSDEKEKSSEIEYLLDRERKLRLLSPWADSFEDFDAILLETPLGQRFIWRNIDTGFIGEVNMDSGEYENVVNEFVQWFSSLAI